jgi:hypothetical protein
MAVSDPNDPYYGGEAKWKRMDLPSILLLLRTCQKHLAYQEEWPSISNDVRQAANDLEKVIQFKRVESRHRDAIYDDNISNRIEMLLDEVIGS